MKVFTLNSQQLKRPNQRQNDDEDAQNTTSIFKDLRCCDTPTIRGKQFCDLDRSTFMYYSLQYTYLGIHKSITKSDIANARLHTTASTTTICMRVPISVANYEIIFAINVLQIFANWKQLRDMYFQLYFLLVKVGNTDSQLPASLKLFTPPHRGATRPSLTACIRPGAGSTAFSIRAIQYILRHEKPHPNMLIRDQSSLGKNISNVISQKCYCLLIAKLYQLITFNALISK